MTRRYWQALMIALARSNRIKTWAQGSRGGAALATRYVAGRSAMDAARAAQTMKERGINTSLFYLGEYVDAPRLVGVNVEQKLAAVDALADARLDIHVSVDPTQIGFLVDRKLAWNNAFAIAERIAKASQGRPGTHVLMLDMEDQSVVDATLALYDELRAAGLPVGVTLQAYLRRTEEDLRARIARGAMVRLVKGAFAAGSAVAYTSRDEIKGASRRLIELMLSENARALGFRPVIATHDTALQAHASAVAANTGWSKGEYEFEMLLGVRPDLADDLARRSERIRLYVPFGEDWWPHALRRIGESPSNAWLLARSLLGG